MYLLLKQKRLSDKQDYDVFDEDGRMIYRVEEQPMRYGRYLTIYDSESGQELAVLKDIEAGIYEIEMGLFVAEERVLSVKQARLGYHVTVPLAIIGKDWRFDNRDDGYRYHIVNGNDEDLILVRRDYQVTHSGYELFIADETLNPILGLGLVLAGIGIDEQTKE
ncbi:hypothetical protein [Jeotgalibaca sp. A122]|uniref:hypothetical protein n=1 Tax=Jeotgalibaca sp. A122 TaxID=3457322 RepID=UPI003FD5A83C